MERDWCILIMCQFEELGAIEAKVSHGRYVRRKIIAGVSLFCRLTNLNIKSAFTNQLLIHHTQAIL